MTTNLKAAMVSLRASGVAECTIWIDALCINQQDVDEKSSQVAYMPRIYEKSSMTMAWLGADNDAKEGRKAMKAVKLLGEVFSAHTTAETTTVDEELLKKLLNDLKDRKEIDNWEVKDALHVLFKLPWWQRRWVVQEVALSKNCILMCGDEAVEWRHFTAASLFLAYLRYPWRHPDVDQHRSHVAGLLLSSHKNCLRFEHLRRRKTQLPLLELLELCRGYYETDAKDAVFAMVSLMAESGAIKPDYRKTVNQVYLDVAVHQLAQSQPLDILHHCFYDVKMVAVPSWIPDWRVKASCRTPVQIGWEAIDEPTLSTLSADKTTLRVTARRICKITTTHLMPSGIEKPTDPAEVSEWLDLALNRTADPSLKPQPLWIWPIVHLVDQFSRYSLKPPSSTPPPPPIDVLSLARLVAGLLAFLEAEDGVPPDALLPGIARETDAGTLDRMKQSFAALATRDARIAFNEALEACRGRRAFQVAGGWLALGQPSVEAGDELVWIAGCKNPFVVRERGGRFVVVGPAYVADIGARRFAADVKVAKKAWEQIDLV